MASEVPGPSSQSSQSSQPAPQEHAFLTMSSFQSMVGNFTQEALYSQLARGVADPSIWVHCLGKHQPVPFSVNSSNSNSGTKSSKFQFCYAYNYSQCHYGVNCRFLHRCMVCIRGFLRLDSVLGIQILESQVGFLVQRVRTSILRPPHLLRKESLDRICFLVIKSLHFKLCPELLRGKILKQILCTVLCTAKFVVTSLFRQSMFI